MKHKAAALEGALLDAAVAKAEGIAIRIVADTCLFHEPGRYGDTFAPSRIWSQGGPIIDARRITWTWQRPHSKTDALCIARCERWDHSGAPVQTVAEMPGPDPLVASMRALVASHFGDEVDL